MSTRQKKLKDTLDEHQVILDKEGKLLSWFDPQQLAYDHVMWLAWDFIKNKVPTENNGLKTYLAYSTFDRNPPFRGGDWPHDQGELYAGFVDSLVSYYPYFGDHSLISIVQEMLDYCIKHGLTPADWDWANVPFASSDAGATEYQGAHEYHYDPYRPGVGDGIGVIEVDKVGELGLAYLTFFKLTGKQRYLKVAIDCANGLASHVRPGDADHSPLPFRVYAWNGVVREEYTSSMISSVRLFDELIRLKYDSVKNYKKARDLLWSWILAYPMRNNKWKGSFSDIPLDPHNRNRDPISAMKTAQYTLQHPEMDPDWESHVSRIINWTELTFGEEFWGVQAIHEQLWWFLRMGSHTARFAALCALWYEKTGDETYKEKAYRAFNYATYFARENGVILDVFEKHKVTWFADGYADYVRHFMAGLGSIPEWAPTEKSHLLRSSSIITDIEYTDKQVNYKTFDPDALEVLRLNFTPSRIIADGEVLKPCADLGQSGWNWDPKLSVLRIHHKRAVNIQVGRQ